VGEGEVSVNFDNAFEVEMEVEVGSAPNGGYTNDPNDPGGETKWGISKRANPNVDIANLTKDGAKPIYKVKYWDPLNLDNEAYAIALLLFDTSVNQGLAFAHTLPRDFVGICTARMLRYAANPNFSRYGKGWFNRVFIVIKALNP
jgi:lysozyme family protein